MSPRPPLRELLWPCAKVTSLDTSRRRGGKAPRVNNLRAILRLAGGLLPGTWSEAGNLMDRRMFGRTATSDPDDEKCDLISRFNMPFGQEAASHYGEDNLDNDNAPGNRS